MSEKVEMGRDRKCRVFRDPVRAMPASRSYCGRLGGAYAKRIRGSRADNLEAAIKAYEAALTVFTREAFPRDSLRTSRLLASIFMEKYDWSRALSALSNAREAFVILFGEGVDEEEARDVISGSGSLFADLAYTETAMDQAKVGLGTLSEGGARLLAAALKQQGLALTPDQEIEHQTLLLEIREWKKRAEAKGVEGAKALGRLSQARAKLAALVKASSGQGASGATIDAIARQGLLKEGALVAPIVTDVGSKFLVVTAREDAASISVVDYPELTANTLKALLRQRNYAGGRQAPNELRVRYHTTSLRHYGLQSNRVGLV